MSNDSLSKIGHDFKWQGVSKLIFLDEIFFQKIRFNFSLKKCCQWMFKKDPLSMLILGQKSCFLGPTIFKIPQPN